MTWPLPERRIAGCHKYPMGVKRLGLDIFRYRQMVLSVEGALCNS